MYSPLDPESSPCPRPPLTLPPPAAPAEPAARKAKPRLLPALLGLAGAAGLAGAVVLYETDTSRLQASLLSRYAATLTYALEEGPSEAIRFPDQGPFDQLLGYTQLPGMLERVQQSGFRIDRQVRFSPALLSYTDRGFFPPYAEKDQAGLTLLDCRAEPMYQFRYPRHGYPNFAAIPRPVVQALLFIENKELLDPGLPYLNPAVDWGRFSKAVVLQVAEELGLEQDNMGGSTLATQIEKYRHSADGITWSATEKLLQMASASVRAYRGGEQTVQARRELVLSYMNTVPLSAAPGHGQVHGLGDGLRVWFGADFERVNALLRQPPGSGELLAEQGQALRRVVALMIAHRRPTYYLAQGRDELASLTDSYLRLMSSAGEISPALRDAALKQPLAFRNFRTDPALHPMPTNKGVTVARSRLTGLLGVSLYDLDRMDLTARSTLQGPMQAAASAYLQRLRDPAFAQEMGLVGDRLLAPSQAPAVRYSFTLFERTADGNRVRVQTDNTDQPFDINEGSKLELGSTAKLRVLATYLEVMAELHERYAAEPKQALRALTPQDPLTRWAIDYLTSAEDTSLPALLDAALARRYSASPHEAFFTGGGLHTFGNFRKEDNHRIATVREALRESLNLPFVRMLQDLVRYSSLSTQADRAELLGDDHHPARREYLRRFADREGLAYLQRFWRKYQGKDPAARLEAFLGGLRPTPARLAAVHRYVFPEAPLERFAGFLRERPPEQPLSDSQIESLYRQYGPGGYKLPDQAYIARVHPLELWLLRHLETQPQARFSDVAAASEAVRQEVYGWLLRTRAKNARDLRIRTMLEVEAFSDIHQRWKRLGYPFEHLVPSLATALGSSGDRPAALAELMGIIQNDGIRAPSIRIDQLHFAQGTPYETQLSRVPVHGEG